jgi:hypothetical protein
LLRAGMCDDAILFIRDKAALIDEVNARLVEPTEIATGDRPV